MHNYALKNKDLKGEWLIFKKENNYNTYLCLATHNEKDEYILDNKIKKHYKQVN